MQDSFIIFLLWENWLSPVDTSFLGAISDGERFPLSNLLPLHQRLANLYLTFFIALSPPFFSFPPVPRFYSHVIRHVNTHCFVILRSRALGHSCPIPVLLITVTIFFHNVALILHHDNPLGGSSNTPGPHSLKLLSSTKTPLHLH